MPATLRTQLSDLAASFADSVLAAIRSASLEDLLAESHGASKAPAARPRKAPAPAAVAARPAPAKASGRLPRRSPEQIARALDRVVTLVKKHKEGLRAEQIRTELGLLSKEMPRILKEAVAAKKLTTKGQKRATTYFAK
jgi:hypothetical protein